MQSYPAASIAARRHSAECAQPPPAGSPPVWASPVGPPPAVPVCEPHMPGPPPPHQQYLPAPPPSGAQPTTPSKHWLVARLEKACHQAENEVAVAGSTHSANRLGYERAISGSLGFNPPAVHHGIYHGVQPGGSGEPDPSADQYQVDVDCRVGRHRTALLLQPTPHYAADPARSYTSVNLTLRPPPPSGAPQPDPIDIQSAGSSLTYSSSSYDPRQGLQSQLRIRIGPAGQGSVSAMRTRVAPPANPAPIAAQPTPTVQRPIMDDLLEQVRARGAEHLDADTKLHLLQQLERKVLLEAEVQLERSKLLAMQKEVQSLEEDLAKRGLTVPAISAGPTDQSTCLTIVPGPKQEAAWEIMEKTAQIREEIRILQEECKRMTQEVDRQAPESRLPATLEADTETAEDGRWTCRSCTFHNHELLESCEECEMPRLRLGTAGTTRFNNHPFQELFHEEPSSASNLPTHTQTDSVTQLPAGHLTCYKVPVTLPSLPNS